MLRMLSSKRIVLVSMVQHHRLSLCAVAAAKNHYDSLGITPKATQSDVKAAYYKLSMVYHPDKNKGSDSASEKFRAITEAYEVLGNYKLRKLYDKGIPLTPGVKDEDDDRTRFYKSRERRDKAPTATGKTPIYNFDEWSQAHYGEAFARRAAAKVKYENKMKASLAKPGEIEKEIVVFSLVMCVMVYLMFTFSATRTYDTPEEFSSNLNKDDVDGGGAAGTVADKTL